MDNQDNRYSLFLLVVNRGRASKILKDAKKMGVSGGTIVYGYGRAKDDLLKPLEIDEIEKEILIMVVKKDLERQLFDRLEKKYDFKKPNQGIAFTSPIRSLAGIKSFIPNNKTNKREGCGDSMEYEAIFVVVDKNEGEEVIESAEKYGSRGATIIPGRGSGIHEKGTIFNLMIEPEKDIVIMVVESKKTNDIINAIKKDLKIDEPGEGIVFALGVNQTLGLME